ncbi:hypothetical protein QBC47DRAFT_408214 [Echria macrotheca]|uniref:Uncharacterized protein n=1 Tax=Echria macrotheca TaxID=438768 RepID=A0AAJ0FAH4_9PEZI|nr:hypothetical protein QBC47DRAFT_408214 [Echria macrotheca]
MNLELAISTYENDSFTCLLRVDLEKKTGRALILLKPPQGSDSSGFAQGFVNWLEKDKETLNADPFLLANHVLSFYQYWSYSYVNWRKALYDMESQLGVTERAAVLEKTGYQTVSFDYDKLNQANALLRLAELLQSQASGNKISITTEEIRSTILRAELFLPNAAMVDRVSWRVLYNRITKHDSNSLKTIAVVTLVFLPPTFVSAIFSTGVFNFHADDGDHPQTISRWAWVYLLLCLLVTAVTVLLWRKKVDG